MDLLIEVIKMMTALVGLFRVILDYVKKKDR